jgi:hypothetical protein
MINHIVVVLLVVVTIPSVIATLRHYLPSRPPSMVSKGEIEALDYLSEQPEGIVLTQAFDREAANEAVANPPRPLYLYESTAYVSAFSGKQVYMEDEVNLEITGYDWRGRREEIERILGYRDIKALGDFLKGNNITYVYWIKDGNEGGFWEDKSLDKVFENEEVNLYKSR